MDPEMEAGRDWTETLMHENRDAADEFEAETGVTMDPNLVLEAASSPTAVLEMLNMIASTKRVSEDCWQDHPVFCPLYDKQVIICRHVGERRGEQFRMFM